MQSVCRMNKNFTILLAAPTSYWRLICLYRATSSEIQHNSMLELVLISIPAENFVAIQHCENELTDGTILIKHEFLRSRNCTLRVFRENNDDMSYLLPPANTENS